MAYIGKQPSPAVLTASDITDGIISEAKMANDAISLAELKAGTDGNIISYDASGNPVAIATGSDGQVLTSTGAGSPPAFEAVSAEKTLPYFFATINTSQSVAAVTETTLQYTVEVFDSGSSYNTGTYKWIPQTAGKYLIFHQWSVNTSTDCYAFNAVAKNGTQFARFNGRNFDTDSYYCQGITSLNGSSDYVTALGYHEQGGSITNPSNANVCYFGGLLLSAT